MINALRDALRDVLTADEMRKIVRSYDMIGDVLLVKLHPDLRAKKREIGRALKKAFPHVRTIAAVPLFGKTHDKFRTRDIDVIFGDECTETLHKEWGCVFKVDIRRAFFSPRLAYERMRIAKKVKPGETVVNMFAGVGCFSIIIAKIQPEVGRIYSVDINPDAYRYMCENIRLNGVEDKVIPVLGDARDVLKHAKISRVLMPLPDKAHEFLADVVRAVDDCAVIHYYDIAYATDGATREERTADIRRCAERGIAERRIDLFAAPYERALSIIRSSASASASAVSVCVEEMRVVRSVGPRRYHVVIDLRMQRQGAEI